ncbi:unnamed protein product, partial [Adineta steineri]
MDKNENNTMEQCLTKKENTIKSNVMSLPNELLEFILIYLSSYDMIESFYGLNKRLNFLINQFPYTDDINDDGMTLNHNVALLLLFQNDSIIEKLILKDISDLSILWFSFKPNLLKMNESLKELTIKLHYIHDLFILIEYLPKLEYLNVEVCELDKNDKYDY